VPETNNYIPWPTIFCPDAWIRGKDYPAPGVDLEFYEYYNGADLWGCGGNHLVGDEQQWREGCLSTDPVPEYDPLTLCPVECDCVVIPPVVCEFCPGGAYEQYRLTITGATGIHVIWNGTWPLEYLGECAWQGPGPVGSLGVSLTLSFSGDVPPKTELTIFGGQVGGDFNYFTVSETACLGPAWTMDRIAGAGTLPLTALLEITP